jgi:hypothetical protein
MNETCKSCPRPAVVITTDHTDLCTVCHGLKYSRRKVARIKSNYYPCS